MEHLISGKNVVLYFNDAQDIATLLHHACAAIDCVVEFIEQPEVGISAIRGGLRPVAVVVDVFMPRIETENLLQQIRDVQFDVPVLLVSAVPGIKSAAQRFKAVDYLVKPFVPEQFIAMLMKVMPTRPVTHSLPNSRPPYERTPR